MSDPVTNVEIEDVLSSIRRLVSESGGSASRSSAEAQQPAPRAEATPKTEAETKAERPAPAPAPQAAAGMDKLVLTPALRIAETGAAQPEEEAAPQEPETQTVPAEAPSDPPQEPEATVAPDAASDDAPDAGPVSEGDTPAAENDSLKRRIEQLEAAVSTQDESWDEDESHDDSDSDSAEALPWEDHDSGALEPEAATYFSQVDEAGETEAEDLAEDLTEQAIKQATEHATEHTEDHPTEAPTDAASQDSAAQAAYDYLAGEETLIDEEALREMVAEIVRQELQGALGERITRNVRKLVRREIHRALMAQEFD